MRRRITVYAAFALAALVITVFDAVLAKQAVEVATLAATLKAWLKQLRHVFAEE